MLSLIKCKKICICKKKKALLLKALSTELFFLQNVLSKFGSTQSAFAQFSGSKFFFCRKPASTTMLCTLEGAITKFQGFEETLFLPISLRFLLYVYYILLRPFLKFVEKIVCSIILILGENNSAEQCGLYYM